jgi:hypothetical protein
MGARRVFAGVVLMAWVGLSAQSYDITLAGKVFFSLLPPSLPSRTTSRSRAR